MKEDPTRGDYLKLRDLYEVARESLPEVTRPNGRDPVYTREIDDLCLYINTSPWVNHEYALLNWARIRKDCAAATVQEVCAVFTAFIRGERFCSGFLEKALRNDWLEGALARADELT